MAHHLEHSSEQAHGGVGRGGQQHVAHVTHGAVGHHPFHVGLGDGGQGAVQHRNGGPDRQAWSQFCPGLREQLQAEAQQSVGAQLEQHTSQQHRHGRGGLGVGVGQPVVQRHQRDLDAEADQQSAEQPELAAHRQPLAEHRGEAEIHRAGEQRQAQEGPQDQHPGDGREDQELRGRVGTVDTPPHRHQQPERNQLQFIEEEEQQQVFRQERAIHRTADQQQHGEVEARPLADVARDHG